jgi:hypothetical protein
MSESISDDARRTGPALEQTYRFLLWLIPTVDKFPRKHKFLLGDRIQATAFEVLEGLVEATCTRKRGRAAFSRQPKIGEITAIVWVTLSGPTRKFRGGLMLLMI